GRCRRGADRAGLADVVRAVALRAALEVVALDRAGEALALRDAGDLDLVARAERVGLADVADLPLARLLAELAQVAHRRRADRLRRRLVDVDQPLVRADLEVLLGVLVLERRADHGVDVLLRGQGHGAGHGRAGALRRLHDLLGRRLDRRGVVALQADPDLLLS